METGRYCGFSLRLSCSEGHWPRQSSTRCPVQELFRTWQVPVSHIIKSGEFACCRPFGVCSLPAWHGPPLIFLCPIPSCRGSCLLSALCPPIASDHFDTCRSSMFVFLSQWQVTGLQMGQDRCRCWCSRASPVSWSSSRKASQPGLMGNTPHFSYPSSPAWSQFWAPCSPCAALLCPTHLSALTPFDPGPLLHILSFHSSSLPLGPRASAHPGGSPPASPS